MLIDLSIQKSNKRLKLSAPGDDTSSLGYNLTTPNPAFGPEFALRSLIPGQGIEFLTVNEGKNLLVTNTFGTAENGNYYHLYGKLPALEWTRTEPVLPSGQQVPPSEQKVVRPGLTYPVKGANHWGNDDDAGPTWLFQQTGFTCNLVVSNWKFYGSVPTDPVFGPAPYLDQKTGITYTADYLLVLSIPGLPLSAEPLQGFGTNFGELQFTTNHKHAVGGRTGGRDDNAAVPQHSHIIGSNTLEMFNHEVSKGVAVSFASFSGGNLVLHLRNLAEVFNLQAVTSTSPLSISWVAKMAVNGELSPESSGVILAANGLTASSNVASRTVALETTTAALDVALLAKADTSYVDQGFSDISVNFAGAFVSQAAYDSSMNLKAPKDNPTFTGTVSGVTKAMVGLSQVDNTSDDAKPISSLTQTALNLKAATTYVNSENAAQNALITELQKVPHVTVAFRTKSYTFQAAVPRNLDSTGATNNLLAGSGGSTILSFDRDAATGYVIGNWTGIIYCNVLAQVNFQYATGVNDNQVTIWLHNVGPTLPGAVPTLATAVNSLRSYAVVRNQAGLFYTAQFNALLAITGGVYYTLGMQSTAAITYNVDAVVSIQAVYGD